MNALQLLVASYIASDSTLTSEEVNAIALCVNKIAEAHQTNEQKTRALVRFIEAMLGEEDCGDINDSIALFVYSQYEE